MLHEIYLVFWNTWNILSTYSSLAILGLPTFFIHVAMRVNLANEIASHWDALSKGLLLITIIDEFHVNLLSFVRNTATHRSPTGLVEVSTVITYSPSSRYQKKA